MKIALTGGSGAVGRGVIAKALAEGHQIVSVDRVEPDRREVQAGVTNILADVADFSALVRAFAGCDALIHLAAIPNPKTDPAHIVHNNNVTGSYNAMQAAVENGITRICQASSVNAIGVSYSRTACYDYFPIDELHSTYNEDAYSLSKWLCEQQADSLVRRHDKLRIASMRFHWVTPDRDFAIKTLAQEAERATQELWGYTLLGPTAQACLLSLTAEFSGHEVFNIAAPDTAMPDLSRDLAAKFYPDVPLRDSFTGRDSFFSSAKAESVLGWKHNGEGPETTSGT